MTEEANQFSGTLKDEKKGKNDTTDKKKGRKRQHRFSVASTKLKNDWDLFSEILNPRRASNYLKRVLFFFILPATGIAAFLFYSLENPHTGYKTDGVEADREKASISWWLLFLVRQIITLSLAFATQAVIIDFLATGSWIFLRFFGPMVRGTVRSYDQSILGLVWKCHLNLCVLR